MIFVLNVKAIVSVFNQEKVLVGSFSVIVKSLRTIVCSLFPNRVTILATAGGRVR